MRSDRIWVQSSHAARVVSDFGGESCRVSTPSPKHLLILVVPSILVRVWFELVEVGLRPWDRLGWLGSAEITEARDTITHGRFSKRCRFLVSPCSRWYFPDLKLDCSCALPIGEAVYHGE